MISIYVLPTEEGKPPRAILMSLDMQQPESENDPVMIQLTEKHVQWSFDTGAWMDDGGIPAPQEISDAITEHAKNLGVEW